MNKRDRSGLQHEPDPGELCEDCKEKGKNVLAVTVIYKSPMCQQCAWDLGDAEYGREYRA